MTIPATGVPMNRASLGAKAVVRGPAEQLGTLVREGVAATNIREEGDSWRVDAGGETYEAPVLVNAAGAWGGRIASSAPERAPSWPS